ncbi:MAG: radical SAM protein [Bacteroidetes bacterium]|nr:radical SAM protein [Bacteroidota bacterium]
MKNNKTMIIQLQDKFVQQEKLESVSTDMSNQQFIISGFKQKLVHTRLKISLLKIAIKCYRNPLDWLNALHYLVKLRRRFLGDNKLHKLVYAGGKYYMGLYTPGWNSKVYQNFISSQLHDFKPVKQKVNRFNSVFIAITKKCALRCEHCYEWENLNKKEVLTTEKLNEIVRKIQDKGVSQIQFLGGEPLIKINTLLQVLKQAVKTTDFWVVTSGFKLTANNAKQLKEAGLTGVIISLDHFIPEKHNTFRGFKDAYFWVEEAVKNAIKNNLVTALSLCVTKEFISEKNLTAYMNLAKELKVSFVQFIEPKAVGHYAGKDVLLKQYHILILEDFFLKMNFNSAYNSYPIITYHEYYQRRQGCFGGGLKGMYVDTDGDINACPFCPKKTGNVLDDSFEENLNLLKLNGCKDYKIKTN